MHNQIQISQISEEIRMKVNTSFQLVKNINKTNCFIALMNVSCIVGQ